MMGMRRILKAKASSHDDHERCYDHVHDDECQRANESKHWDTNANTCESVANWLQSGRRTTRQRTPSFLLTRPKGPMSGRRGFVT